MPQEKRLLYEDLTYKIRGCIFVVYNSLGFGHKESIYQKALEIELGKNSIQYQSQKIIDVYYDNKRVGIYKPDLIIEDKIIIEIKAAEFNINKFDRQTLNYLKGTKYRIGLLVNFGKERIYIKRMVDSYKKSLLLSA